MGKKSLCSVSFWIFAATLLAGCAGSAASTATPTAEGSPYSSGPIVETSTANLATPQPTDVLLETALGGPVRPTPTTGMADSLRQVAEEMAASWGVSVEEAYQRLRSEDPIGTLQAELTEWEADTFAGLWIEHEPQYRVVVAFTRDGEETLEPYLANRSIPGLTIRQARFTYAELEGMQAQAMRELDKLDFEVHVLFFVQDNRVEVHVSDRAWFEEELRRVGARLAEGVELVVVQGGSTARDKDLLLTPPVPGIAFPRQKPVEGFRESMTAQLIGTLRLEGACLQVQSQGGELLLPIWPPEFTLRQQGDQLAGEQVLVIDGEGQVAARAGEEVYLGGGYVAVTDEWVLQQIPAACQGEYFVVGNEVRPNLRYDSDLFALDVVSITRQTALFLRYKPALDEQVVDEVSITGKLVAYDTYRCLHLQTDWGPGSVTLLWPANWSARADDEAFVVLDGTGRIVVRVGDEVHLHGRTIRHDVNAPVYGQLIDELPGDCVGASWLVDGVD
jgi:hypothetical protein